MEILLGALITLLTELVKWLSDKYANRELVRAGIILVTFILTVIASGLYLYLKTTLNWEIVVTIWVTSIGFYEVIIKTLLKPAFSKLLKK